MVRTADLLRFVSSRAKVRFDDILRAKTLEPVKPPVRKVLKGVRNARVRLSLTHGTEPFNKLWERYPDLPIHRYYLELFLAEFSRDIRGRCLEFQCDEYASRFGGARISKLDIIHIDHGNPRATLVADLTKSNDIPSDLFDCIICTYVLHVVYDFKTFIKELHRILAPGGVLFMVVPMISPIYPNAHELWRFTPEGLRLALEEVFTTENITIRSYGNSLTAICDVRGFTAYDMRDKELHCHDESFSVEVCARALKQS